MSKEKDPQARALQHLIDLVELQEGNADAWTYNKSYQVQLLQKMLLDIYAEIRKYGGKK